MILIYILTIDVEAWFSDLNFNDWKKLNDYRVQKTIYLLNILKEKNNNATFFILGYFAYLIQ